MTPIRIGVVGIGKIARDQHLPALAPDPSFDLIAGATRHPGPDGLKTFIDTQALLEGAPEIEAVSFCTPPVGRFEIARLALEQGRHVMLEKPPGATVAEVEQLARLAASKGLTLFCTWHSREAASVAPAKAWLADKTVRSANVVWKEDVRRWHPGQDWIWQPGGLGVFDPGINALSILTAILPEAAILESAELSFPDNRAAPIAADLNFRTVSGALVTAVFDWRQTGPQTWDITVETDAGTLILSDGGARMSIDGKAVTATATDALEGEYPNLYRRFAELIRAGQSDTDLEPFRHVADAFMLGRRVVVEAFHD